MSSRTTHPTRSKPLPNRLLLPPCRCSAALQDLDDELRYRGYAPKTRDTYGYHVRQFLEAVRDGLPESDAGLRTHIIHCLEERGYSIGYADQSISALKFFYRFMRPDTLSLSRMPTFRRSKPLPKVLSRKQVASLFEHADRPRDRALLMMVYSSGLRVSEIVRLRPSDFDREREVLRVSESKGGIERLTIYSELALAAVEKHWPHEASDRWVFAGQKRGTHISKRTAQRAFTRARDAVGIQLKVGVHTLRHSFATHLLEQGLPLIYLQKLLGHKSMQSTIRYLHATRKELSRIRSPLDELMEGPIRPASELGKRQVDLPRSAGRLSTEVLSQRPTFRSRCGWGAGGRGPSAGVGGLQKPR